MCYNCPYTACYSWCPYRNWSMLHYCEYCGANLDTGGHYDWCCKCAPRIIYIPQSSPQPRWRLEWVPEQTTAKKRSDRDW